MIYHPVVDIKIGDSPITTLPPEYLTSFEYKASINTLNSFQFNVTDPSYHKFEDMLLFADRDSRATFVRFGYSQGGIHVMRNWIRGFMINYLPKISNKGMEILANFQVLSGEASSQVKPQQFSGKVSDVVIIIANALDMNYEVEETNDDDNVSHIDYENGPRIWTTGTLGIIRFIRKKLLPIARSKTSKGSYELFVSHDDDGLGKPTLHFHTQDFSGCSRRNGENVSVQYMAGGDNDYTIELIPSFDSKALGNFGVGSTVSRSFDNATSRSKHTVNNTAVTEYDSDTQAIGTKVAAPVNPTDPESDSVSHGIVADKEINARVAEDRANNRWHRLNALTYSASLNIVDVPKYVLLDVADYIDASIIVPYGSSWRRHWSSGRWYTSEVVHRISSSYAIEAQLERRESTEGDAEKVKASEAIPSLSSFGITGGSIVS